MNLYCTSRYWFEFSYAGTNAVSYISNRLDSPVTCINVNFEKCYGNLCWKYARKRSKYQTRNKTNRSCKIIAKKIKTFLIRGICGKRETRRSRSFRLFELPEINKLERILSNLVKEQS